VDGEVLVQQAERVRQALRREQLARAAKVPAGQVARRLTPAVEDEHRAVAVPVFLRRREGSRRGMCEVVRYELDDGRVEAGHRLGQERGRALSVLLAQPVPRVVEADLGGRTAQPRVEGVRDRVEARRVHSCRAQAPRG
jgi:hypothetical protein